MSGFILLPDFLEVNVILMKNTSRGLGAAMSPHKEKRCRRTADSVPDCSGTIPYFSRTIFSGQFLQDNFVLLSDSPVYLMYPY